MNKLDEILKEQKVIIEKMGRMRTPIVIQILAVRFLALQVKYNIELYKQQK